MKKRKIKWVISLLIFAILISYGYFAVIKKTGKNADEKNVIEVKRVENFKVKKLSAQESYLVFQEYGEKVEEITSSGDVVQKYKIEDSDFQARTVHQKPSLINELFIGGVGEVGNWYYTYNIKEKRFSKVPLDGVIQCVDSVSHFGKDIIFSTDILSEPTSQSIDHIPVYKKGIYNSTTKKLYEPEVGVGWSKILQLGEQIVYVPNDVKMSETQLLTIDKKTGKFGQIYLNEKENGYSTLFSSDKHAYVISEDGEIQIYDNTLNVEIATPYEEYVKLYKGGYIEFYDEASTLALSDNKILQTLAYNKKYEDLTSHSIIGILDLSGKPKFKELKKDFLPRDKAYRLLYQDQENGLIFIVQEDLEDDDSPYSGHILVLDNKTYDLVDKIYMEEVAGVDFVVKL